MHLGHTEQELYVHQLLYQESSYNLAAATDGPVLPAHKSPVCVNGSVCVKLNKERAAGNRISGRRVFKFKARQISNAEM